MNLKELREELTKVSALNEKGKKKIEDLKDDLQIIKATEHVLKNDNEKLLSEISNLQHGYHELEKSEKIKSDMMKSEVETLQIKLTESITPDSVMVKLNEQEQSFKEKLQKKQQTIDQLMSTISKTKEDRDKIEEQHTKLGNDKVTIEQKLSLSEKNCKELQDTYNKLLKNFEELQSKLKEVELGNLSEVSFFIIGKYQN